MEIAALVLSIVSFIVSSVIGIYEIFENRKLKNISLESEYFDSLFKDFLLKKIPITRTKIRFDINSKLVDTDEFIDVLNEMRHNALYFLYTDKKFFNKLKNSLQDLEDYNSGDKVIAGEEQTDFFKTIQDKLVDIYDIMLNKYKGNKIYKSKK